MEMVLVEAPDKSTREVADLFRVNQSTVSRTRQKLRAGDANASPLVVSGRDGKTYHYLATSVENPSVARIAGRLLAELGDDAPEGGASLRTLNKRRFEMDRRELLDRTAPALPGDYKIHALDFRRLGSRIVPESVQLVVSDPPWLGEYEGLVVHPASPLTPGTAAMPGRRRGRCLRRRPQTNGWRCQFQ